MNKIVRRELSVLAGSLVLSILFQVVFVVIYKSPVHTLLHGIFYIPAISLSLYVFLLFLRLSWKAVELIFYMTEKKKRVEGNSGLYNKNQN